MNFRFGRVCFSQNTQWRQTIDENRKAEYCSKTTKSIALFFFNMVTVRSFVVHIFIFEFLAFKAVEFLLGLQGMPFRF